MATYKVIQDIEADDKFLGPLTLKQFVFGAGGLFFGWLCAFCLMKGFPYGLIIFAPPMFLGFFLAVPWSRDQSTEIWVLAKLRFYFKPRKRIWDQSGMEELVTITAPKKIEKVLTKGFSQNEVKSRLEALAQTIDSRGWAIKELSGGYTYQPVENTDRLVDPSVLPQEVPIIDTNSIPDVYAGETAVSANLDRMIEQSTELRKQQSLDKMNRIRSGEPLENITVPEVHITPPSIASPAPALSLADEKQLVEELKTRQLPNKLATAHMRNLSPISATPQSRPIQAPAPKPITPDTAVNQPVSPVTMRYAGNNDLSVEAIAHQAKKDSDSGNEVIVSLR